MDAGGSRRQQHASAQILKDHHRESADTNRPAAATTPGHTGPEGLLLHYAHYRYRLLYRLAIGC